MHACADKPHAAPQVESRAVSFHHPYRCPLMTSVRFQVTLLLTLTLLDVLISQGSSWLLEVGGL